MRILYTSLLYLLTPVVIARLLWRGLELHQYWRRWNERFGFVQTITGGTAVWIHAVSVGESLAAVPLIRRLVSQHGQGRVLVTTTTPTGSERIIAALGDSVLHNYAPYDLPDAVARFLHRTRPQQVIVMETELWPNLFRALASRGIPLTIANARMSPRSFAGYSRVPRFARSTLANCSQIAAQSELDAQRFRALGGAQVTVMGNIKFDIELPQDQLVQGQALRARFGADRPVWIAASTHEGEEQQILDAHHRLLQILPRSLLILVPRHPQRFETVARLIERAQLDFVKRSNLTESAEVFAAQVLLGDSMGEMFAYYAASDVAFVGGSLVDVGGHNILEPAALGVPVLFGPQMDNFLPARELLLDCGGAIEIANADELSRRVFDLLRDAAARSTIGEAARSAVSANRGALEKLMDLLAKKSPASPGNDAGPVVSSGATANEPDAQRG